jgi:hypothetical protein
MKGFCHENKHHVCFIYDCRVIAHGLVFDSRNAGIDGVLI